jgi:hypothetical protein
MSTAGETPRRPFWVQAESPLCPPVSKGGTEGVDSRTDRVPRRQSAGGLRRLWQSRWSLLRLACAGAVLYVLLADNPARLVRLQLASLPTVDYSAEARRLREQHRYAEALVVADAGLAELTGAPRDALEAERARAIDQRDSALRRVKEALRGAVIGNGDSVEALMGAVTADLFVVGDIRDLMIQGSRWALDGEADQLVLVLSALGVLTTVAPEIDWLPAFLKIAEKAGALGKRMTEALVAIARRARATGDMAELRRFATHCRVLVEESSPAGAIRVLRHLEEPKDLEKVAGFLKRGRPAAFALHVADKEGVELVKASARGGEEALVLAAKKGKPGVAWLRTQNFRLLRPHPLLGLAKGLHKGTIPRALERLTQEYLDPSGWLLIPLAALWCVLESHITWRRLRAA